MEGNIHHLEIYVDDLIKTRNFYEELLKTLGYQLYQEWENGFSFKLNGVYIVFVKVEEEYKEYGYHRKRIGLNHLAFGVKNKSEVDTITNVFDWNVLT